MNDEKQQESITESTATVHDAFHKCFDIIHSLHRTRLISSCNNDSCLQMHEVGTLPRRATDEEESEQAECKSSTMSVLSL